MDVDVAAVDLNVTGALNGRSLERGFRGRGCSLSRRGLNAGLDGLDRVLNDSGGSRVRDLDGGAVNNRGRLVDDSRHWSRVSLDGVDRGVLDHSGVNRGVLLDDGRDRSVLCDDGVHNSLGDGGDNRNVFDDGGDNGNVLDDGGDNGDLLNDGGDNRDLLNDGGNDWGVLDDGGDRGVLRDDNDWRSADRAGALDAERDLGSGRSKAALPS